MCNSSLFIHRFVQSLMHVGMQAGAPWMSETVSASPVRYSLVVGGSDPNIFLLS